MKSLIRKAVGGIVRLTRKYACTTYGDTAELSPGPCARCVGRAVYGPSSESRPEKASLKEDLRMGDITITDDGDLGLSIYVNGEKLSFINSLGEIALMEWIAKKHGRHISANPASEPR